MGAGLDVKSPGGYSKGDLEAHSPDGKLRDNPFADYADHDAAAAAPASAAFDPEAARYASFQVQQEPAPMACGCGLQFVLCATHPPAQLTSAPRGRLTRMRVSSLLSDSRAGTAAVPVPLCRA